MQVNRVNQAISLSIKLEQRSSLLFVYIYKMAACLKKVLKTARNFFKSQNDDKLTKTELFLMISLVKPSLS